MPHGTRDLITSILVRSIVVTDSRRGGGHGGGHGGAILSWLEAEAVGQGVARQSLVERVGRHVKRPSRSDCRVERRAARSPPLNSAGISAATPAKPVQGSALLRTSDRH